MDWMCFDRASKAFRAISSARRLMKPCVIEARSAHMVEISVQIEMLDCYYYTCFGKLCA